MDCNRRPTILVHGLWNSSRVFDRLISTCGRDQVHLIAPDLPHQLGKTSLYILAEELNRQISLKVGNSCAIDLLGFSMGGLIARIWLQNFGGAARTNRYISVGTPHRGTFTAQLCPGYLFKGIAQMKRGSALLMELDENVESLKTIDCLSFYCLFDLMTFPGWHAVIPIGEKVLVPVLTHKQLIINPISLNLLAKAVLKE